jgi:hypothetical protein
MLSDSLIIETPRGIHLFYEAPEGENLKSGKRKFCLGFEAEIITKRITFLGEGYKILRLSNIWSTQKDIFFGKLDDFWKPIPLSRSRTSGELGALLRPLTNLPIQGIVNTRRESK